MGFPGPSEPGITIMPDYNIQQKGVSFFFLAFFMELVYTSNMLSGGEWPDAANLPFAFGRSDKCQEGKNKEEGFP